MRLLQQIVFLSAFLMLCSCTVSTGDPADPAAANASGAATPAYYYDFDDILIPEDMSIDMDESFVIETPGHKSGVMVFDGQVEIRSLTDYFIDSMARDNWTLRSAFRSARTILVFEKAARFCVINITDSSFNTLLEIWVSPLAE